MVIYYCFIADVGEASPSQKVFKVKVGQNHRDLVKCSLLENYAHDLGLYFRPWDDTADKMLILRYGRFSADCEKVGLCYETIHCTIAELYRHIMDGNLDALRNQPNYYRNLIQAATILNPLHFSPKSIRETIATATTSHVNYLSRACCREQVKTSLCMLAVAILFIIGGLLENWCHSLGY